MSSENLLFLDKLTEPENITPGKKRITLDLPRANFGTKRRLNYNGIKI